ncbi:hypothetical protein PspS35_12885 [Pseudomonas sp. S35]|nr:hypothetical protein PspS35_12885 [Pseudomonas sp. S35]
MGIVTATIANADDFNRALRTPQPVFMLFVSKHCPACEVSGPLFQGIANEHQSVVSLVLDCAQTPRHAEVTSTPTLLIYLNGTLMEKLQGFGPEDEQAQLIEAKFKHYADRTGAEPPASPAAPPPLPPSGASPHAPGYRPPPASGRAGSSPTPPGFDNPRSRQP